MERAKKIVTIKVPPHKFFVQKSINLQNTYA